MALNRALPGRTLRWWMIAAGLAIAPAAGASAVRGGYQYLSPLPGACWVSPSNGIALRLGDPIARASVRPGLVSVTGSGSGAHEGRLTLSTDGRTLIFDPYRPYALGERVTVNIGSGALTRTGRALPSMRYAFEVSRVDPKERGSLEALLGESDSAERGIETMPARPPSTPGPQACDALPTTYPAITIMTSNGPAPGHIFASPGVSSVNRLLILDNLGFPIFFRYLGGRGLDFRRQPNGLLTYFGPNAFVGLDSSYAVVDTFRTGNGYSTDFHDLQVLPNGHALLMSYDPQLVRMDTVVAGGDPNAVVVGLVIQEIDTAKNVVFQWRSWDHFAITDMDTACASVGSLFSPTVDYAHGNSIELDLDGNLIISSRNLNEITKIDRQTGDIIWRFGPNAKNNQFTIVGDPRGFSHQHDARRLPNGHITLFDNGNCLTPPYSRAVEYQLDEVNMIATQVWEYQHPLGIFASATGGTQRQANGSTLISWGNNAPDPKFTEVRSDGTITFEVGYNNSFMRSYRTMRYPWRTNQFTTNRDTLDFGSVQIGSVATLPLTIRNPGTVARTITCFVSSTPEVDVLDAVPLTIPGGGSAVVQARFQPTAATPLSGNLYVRATTTTEVVAYPVSLSGRGVVRVPAVAPAAMGLIATLLAGVAAWALGRTAQSRGGGSRSAQPANGGDPPL